MSDTHLTEYDLVCPAVTGGLRVSIVLFRHCGSSGLCSSGSLPGYMQCSSQSSSVVKVLLHSSQVLVTICPLRPARVTAETPHCRSSDSKEIENGVLGMWALSDELRLKAYVRQVELKISQHTRSILRVRPAEGKRTSITAALRCSLPRGRFGYTLSTDLIA